MRFSPQLQGVTDHVDYARRSIDHSTEPREWQDHSGKARGSPGEHPRPGGGAGEGAPLHTAPSWWSPHRTFPGVPLPRRGRERQVLPQGGKGSEDSASGCQRGGWVEGLGPRGRHGAWAVVKSEPSHVTLPPAPPAASPEGTWLLLKSGRMSSLVACLDHGRGVRKGRASEGRISSWCELCRGWGASRLPPSPSGPRPPAPRHLSGC